jgi:hypothetical protein
MADITMEKAMTSKVRRKVWRRLGQVTLLNSDLDADRYSKNGFKTLLFGLSSQN